MSFNKPGFRRSVAAAVMAGFAMQFLSTGADADSPPSSLPADDLSAMARGVVTFDDLDLSRPAGLQTLESRIKGAVDRVCEQSDARDISRRHDERECRDTAMADAMAQVQALLVDERIAGQVGRECTDGAAHSALARTDEQQ